MHFFDNGKKARFKMKEIIDSILKAEQQAEQIVADAKVKAAKITGDGEAQVMKVNATSQEDVKNAKCGKSGAGGGGRVVRQTPCGSAFGGRGSR